LFALYTRKQGRYADFIVDTPDGRLQVTDFLYPELTLEELIYGEDG